MGTRSLTYVYSEWQNEEGQKQSEPIVCMYRQFDGYPSGHGAELAKFLRSFAAITNGIAFGDNRKTANGMGCLAAQMIVEFKKDVGGIYLHAPRLDQECWQEYEYHVYEGRVIVKTGSGDFIFNGCWNQFEEFCGSEEMV